jgi:hypothetical protein
MHLGCISHDAIAVAVGVVGRLLAINKEMLALYI